MYRYELQIDGSIDVYQGETYIFTAVVIIPGRLPTDDEYEAAASRVAGMVDAMNTRG